MLFRTVSFFLFDSDIKIHLIGHAHYSPRMWDGYQNRFSLLIAKFAWIDNRFESVQLTFPRNLAIKIHQDVDTLNSPCR